MNNSVRHLRTFQEQMYSLHSNIERALYAAEITCGRVREGCICEFKDRDCKFKSPMFTGGSMYICKLHSLRVLIGDTVVQHDTEVTR